MRFLFCGLLTAAAAFAQQPDPKPLPPAMQDAIRKFTLEITSGSASVKSKLVVTVPQPQAKTCAIPLKNMLRGATPTRMPVVVPPPDKFQIKEVQVPAPSCDDMKK
jgi:hypothetical protein